MVTVYVLSNSVNSERYVGMALDCQSRLLEHNLGKNRYTKVFKQWVIIYSEQCESWESGRKREKYLKSAAGKRWLQKHLSGSLPD